MNPNDLAEPKPRVVDQGLWHPYWSIHKFRDPDDRYYKAARSGIPMSVLVRRFKSRLYETRRFSGNLLLNAGIDEMWLLVQGSATPTNFNNANARIGVGDSTTAAAATQTDLQAATNFLWKAQDSGYPTESAQQSTWRSTFASADANFAWNEIGVDNGSARHKLINRKVQSMGTKASGTSWTATLQITLS